MTVLLYKARRYILTGSKGYWEWLNESDRSDWIGVYISRKEAIRDGRRIGSVVQV